MSGRRRDTTLPRHRTLSQLVVASMSAFADRDIAQICQLLFQTAAEGLVVVDANGTILLQNPRMSELFGYSDQELLGCSIEVLIPDAARDRHARQRAEYAQRPVQRPMGAGLDLRGKRKDGSVFPVEVSLNHFAVEGHRYVMALLSDATQRKAYEEELERNNRELELRVEQRTAELQRAERSVREALEKERELNALKSRFVSMASHEFRTPLSTIMSSADLIDRYTEGPEKERVEKHVKRIRIKVRELTAMLNDFLSLEKLEQGKVAVHASTFDVVHLCIDMIEEIRLLCKPGQEIAYEHQSEERSATLDQQMVANVLSNLLNNAVKYSPEDRAIELSSAIEAGRLRITVSDHGIGIPLEDQQHLFERFFRASNAFTIQGTGLGLSIVKRHLDLMGGTISFTSSPGSGTTFVVDLPAQFCTSEP